jgi:pyruvate formate lyase activating enzyme
MSWTRQFQLYDPEAGRRDETTGLVSDFQRFSIHDGPGIRTVVFFKGCPLRCAWCQNPETVSGRPEIMFIPQNCIGCGECTRVCPKDCIRPDIAGEGRVDRAACLLPECGLCQHVCYANALNISGRYLTVDEVLEVVERDREFYARTGGGLTVSGGEPTNQPVFLLALLAEAKARKLDTAMETCGFAPWETLAKAVKLLDTVLFDVKHMDCARHKEGTGVENTLILDNLRRIAETGVAVRARLPLIPGFNDSEENIRATADFLASLAHPPILDILPYHRMGEPKWSQLDRDYTLHGVTPPTRDEVFGLADLARGSGIEVTVGG